MVPGAGHNDASSTGGGPSLLLWRRFLAQAGVVLGAKLSNEQRFRVIFKAPALRWDTLHLACDARTTTEGPDHG